MSKKPISAPKVELTKRFAVNLQRLREAAGLSKSDLARELFGTITDNRGFPVAKNRGQVGAWESEAAAPRSENVALLAEFFKVDPADLAPDLVGRAAARKPEAMSFRVLDETPDQAHVQINGVFPLEIGAQIMALVAKAQIRPIGGVGNDDADE